MVSHDSVPVTISSWTLDTRVLSSSFLFVRAWQFITTNFLWCGLVLGCLGFVLVFNSPGLVGVEVASGSPMLLGVETELKFEAELRNLRLSEWCEGVSISGHENFESSARILYLLLLLVTSGGENIFWEKLGLSHPSTGPIKEDTSPSVP